MAFGQPPDGFDRPPAHQTKISGIQWDRNFCQAFDNSVERARGQEFKTALASASSANRVHDVVALAPLSQKILDQLGRILQVSVH